MLVLAMESSCDDTAVALYHAEKGLIDHHIYSQTDLQAMFGGVVPELAARDHAAKCSPMAANIIKTNNFKFSDLDGICYTTGPGMVGALLVAACVGQALAESLQIPALGVHHLEAHIHAVYLEAQVPPFPFLALLVSGGHTQLVEVRGLGQYQTLAQTLDDAVGEAFDKVAQLLALPDAGGAAIEKCAAQCQHSDYQFPRPMINRPGLDFSFSGLKTHVANQVAADQPLTAVQKAAIAYAFQTAAVDTLLIKCKRAIEQTGLRHVVLCGGVAANTLLRQGMAQLGIQHGVKAYYPRASFCTDNAAMVAYIGCQRLMAGEQTTVINVVPRWPLDALSPPSKTSL